jgi:polyisoprenoid-binding protein YceI
LAAELEVVVDPTTAKIDFTLGATMHTVEGSLKLKSGEVRFDPATGVIVGKLVIDATSATTGNEGRDKKMHAEVLESAKYAEMVFVPKKVVGAVKLEGESDVTMEGMLTIHGSEHALSVPLKVIVNGNRTTAKGSFKIPFVAWGMSDPSAFILRVEKFVTVNISVTGAIQPAPPQ